MVWGTRGVLALPTLRPRPFHEESLFTWTFNEKGPNRDSHTSKHSPSLRTAKVKRGTRTRGYVKTQQHAFTDGGWSSFTTYTWGCWLLWKVVVTHFCNFLQSGDHRGPFVPIKLKCHMLNCLTEPRIMTTIWMSIRHGCTYRMWMTLYVTDTFLQPWEGLHKNDSTVSWVEASLPSFNWRNCSAPTL